MNYSDYCCKFRVFEQVCNEKNKQDLLRLKLVNPV